MWLTESWKNPSWFRSYFYKNLICYVGLFNPAVFSFRINLLSDFQK